MIPSFEHLERFQTEDPRGAPQSLAGRYGAFIFKFNSTVTPAPNSHIFVIATSGDVTGWEHVSVSARVFKTRKNMITRIPTWNEMCAIKAIFWLPEETVIQFHPAARDYVNHNEHVLHLWRYVGGDAIPTPPTVLVGPLNQEADAAALEAMGITGQSVCMTCGGIYDGKTCQQCV
jgi:hypothetical protein